MDAVSLKLARNYTNEKLNSLPSNAPTKTVTFDGGIYSVGSDVVNGQVSVTLKGRSLKNELNYNRDTWAEWTKTTGVTGDSTGLELVADNTNEKRSTIATNLKGSTKYGILFNVQNNTLAVVNLNAYSSLTGSSFTIANKGITGNAKVIITTQTTIATNNLTIYISSSEPTGNKIKIRDIRLFELPAGSEIEADFETLTADELAQKYPYINGDSVKSTNSVRVKSVGKNLWTKGEIKTAKGAMAGYGNHGMWGEDNSVILPQISSALSNRLKLPNIPLKIVMQLVNSSGISFRIYNAKTSETLYSDSTTRNAGVNIINIPALGETDVRIAFGTYNNTNIITNIMIMPADVDESYEPYKESSVIINLPEPLRSVPNGVKDEINLGQNGTKKTQKNSSPVTINGSSGFLNSWFASSSIEYRCAIPNWAANNNAKQEVIDSGLGISDDGNFPVYVASGKGRGIYFKNNVLWVMVEKAKIEAMPSGGTFEGFKEYLNTHPITLIYQLAEPIVTKLPAQAPLQVFENGTVYVEPIGDASESTLPSVEMTIPTGTSNKFGVATHNYGGAAADWELTNSESKCFLLAVSNAGGSANIIAPDAPGVMYAINNASEYTITIKISGGNGVDVNTGKKVLVIHNGTDYVALTAEL